MHEIVERQGESAAGDDPVDITYLELVAAAERGIERLKDVSSPDGVELRRRLERLLPDLRRAAGLPAPAPSPERRRRQLSLLVQPLS